MKRFILIVLLLVSCNASEQENIKTFSFELVNLNNRSQLSGIFFLVKTAVT